LSVPLSKISVQILLVVLRFNHLLHAMCILSTYPIVFGLASDSAIRFIKGIGFHKFVISEEKVYYM